VTTRQEVERLLSEGKSYREMSQILGKSVGTISDHVAKIKRNAASFGPPAGFDVTSVSQQFDGNGNLKAQTERSEAETEELHGGEFKDGKFSAPIGMFVDRATTQFDGSGVLKNQWVKSKIDVEQRKAEFDAMMEGMMEMIPRLEPLPAPTRIASGLLNLYPFTDCHLGMLAWGKETGDKWDLEIAEATLIQAFDMMCANAIPAETALIAQMGDFQHFDGYIPVTPEHQHVLDADSRFSKMVKIAIRVQRHIIDAALRRHSRVKLVVADANHDPASQVHHRHLFAALYEKEPRLEVVQCEHPFPMIIHGETMLGIHHGHKVKNEAIPGIFATMYAPAWGKTKRRYCHVGHRHHKEVTKEFNGMIVEQHQTIAAKDAYAVRGGWLAQRSITAISYSDTYGEVARTTVTPEMLPVNAEYQR
jgi:hypothetical protein